MRPFRKSALALAHIEMHIGKRREKKAEGGPPCPMGGGGYKREDSYAGEFKNPRWKNRHSHTPIIGGAMKYIYPEMESFQREHGYMPSVLRITSPKLRELEKACAVLVGADLQYRLGEFEGMEIVVDDSVDEFQLE